MYNLPQEPIFRIDTGMARLSQVHNTKTGSWVKRDAGTGRFMDGKSDDKPFKGVRKER